MAGLARTSSPPQSSERLLRLYVEFSTKQLNCQKASASNINRKRALTIFHCNHIVVIQSLEAHESQTGQHMADFIEKKLQEIDSEIKVKLIDCDSAPDFLKLMAELEEDGHRGMHPVIHIECHGDKSEGLEFSNGSTLSWDDLSSAFVRLNIATEFNTIAIVSACFGAYFMGHTSPLLPAPFFALISPSDEINGYEIKKSLEGFYDNFIKKSSIDEGIDWLMSRKLQSGRWFAMSSELWFIKTLTRYIDERCSRRASIERSKVLNAELKKMKKPELSQNKIFEILRSRHRNIEIEAFKKFFCTNELPGNSKRFGKVLLQAQENIRKIRAAGTHIL